jgi:hypothetical protein
MSHDAECVPHMIYFGWDYFSRVRLRGICIDDSTHVSC